MTDHVYLNLKRNRLWPAPEDSWGLEPMFGTDGWCHDCGTPRHEQTGQLLLAATRSAPVGAFVPHWRYDVICLDAQVAAVASDEFTLELRDVVWRGTSRGTRQILIPTVGSRWFDQASLERATLARHGRAGALCSTCGTWRWLPLPTQMLPPMLEKGALSSFDIAASPEWFGDGKQSRRQVLVRRELAELLVASSPRDFAIHRDP